MVEHWPGPGPDGRGAVGTGDLVVLDDALVGAVVAGDGDPHRAVGVVRHQGRVLEPELVPEHGDLRAVRPSRTSTPWTVGTRRS